jgi:hypothetical protein
MWRAAAGGGTALLEETQHELQMTIAGRLGRWDSGRIVIHERIHSKWEGLCHVHPHSDQASLWPE